MDSFPMIAACFRNQDGVVSLPPGVSICSCESTTDLGVVSQVGALGQMWIPFMSIKTEVWSSFRFRPSGSWGS